MKPPATPSQAFPPWQAALLLVGMALVVYFPALSAGFIWDDDVYVSANPLLRDGAGLTKIWLEPKASPQYYPLVFTTFWFEYQLWGVDPFGYHLVNILGHALNGVLLWRLLLRLEIPLAWLSAAVFVLHPVHVESVAWITERKNVLSGIFYLTAALAYFRFEPSATSSTSHRWRWYVLALLLYTAALLSKTVTCSLPAALLLIFWWKRGRLTRATIAPLVPFFCIGLAFAAVTVWMEKEHVGAQGIDWQLTGIERVLIAGRALVFYATSLLWPWELTFIYPRWEIHANTAWLYLFPGAVLSVLIVCWLRRARWGRGPLTVCLLFAGTLFPALGFIDVYPMRFSFVADHFQYLASIPLLTGFVVGGNSLAQRYCSAATCRGLGVALLVVLGAKTMYQTTIYADLPTLWTDTLAKNPACWMAQNNLGEIYFAQKKYADAERHFQVAANLKPEEPSYHYNLGKVRWATGRTDEAIASFHEAVRLDQEYVVAHFNLGLALRKKGELNDAVAHFREALRLNPDFADAHVNLGVALAMQKLSAEAVLHFQRAIALEPNQPAGYFNLALLYAQQGQPREALPYARQAAELAPNDQRIWQLFEGLLRDTKDKK